MKDDEKQPDTPPESETDEANPPDGRGPRPTDPNELAKWIVDQSTIDSDGHNQDESG